jgi:hypothetical protein
VLNVEIPHLPDGSMDVAGFMVSKIDRHPNRRYNTLVRDQALPFLVANGLVREAQADR